MKRLIFAGLVMALFSGNAVFAQSNNSYSDDVYYNGSQAERDAQADAKKQKKQRQTQDQEEQYNSSTGDGYADNNYDGNARVYGNSYNTEDDSYIDYDDDSYTSRMRRFYYPMYNAGYWGGVYSPFWADPFYSNPYYGWGGWYTPGFSIGIGTGWGWGGPYWNNCWGMNTWFGYGGFGSWYTPYYGGFGGWGWGYGSGYWNGYYAGIYDGRFGNRYSPVRTVNYGPRTNRVGLTSVGTYGRSARMTSVDRNTNMVQPFNRSANNNLGDRRAIQLQNTNDRNQSGIRTNNGNSRDAINLDRTNTRVFDGNNGGRRMQVQGDNSGEQRATRRGGFFNFGGNRDNSNRSIRSESNGFSQPSRSFEQRNTQPSRNFSSPAPSRSYSSPSFSSPRSSGGFSGGGGGRVSGGRGR